MPETKTGGVTALFAINAAAVLFFAGVALAATLTSRSQLSSLRVWGASGVAFVLFGALSRTRVLIRRHVVSLLAGVAIGVVTLAHLLRGTASSLYPTSGSVDVVHHYALVQYLFYNGQLPPLSIDPSLAFLGEMAFYPMAAHANAAVLAGASNVQPLVAMTLFVYLIVALSITVLMELTIRTVQQIWPRFSEGAAVSAGVTTFIVFLAVTRYTEGMVMADYFFSQVVGIYLLLVCALGLQEHFARGSRVGLGVSAIASLLLALTYPVYSLIPIATVGLIVLARHGWRWRQWGAVLPVFSATLLGLLLFLPGRMSTGLTIIDNEGGSAILSVSSVGGPVVIALCVVGFAVAITSLVRRRGVAVGVLLATTLVATLQLAGMYLLESTVGIGSFYMARKLVYVVCWLALPFVVVGVFAVGSAILKKRLLNSPKPGVYMAAGLVIITLGWVTLSAPEAGAVPIIDPDSYAVAEWARSEIDGLGQFAVAEAGSRGYMLYVGVMNQPRDPYALAVLLQEYDLLEHWFQSPEKTFLVTTDVHTLENVIKTHDLVIVYQQGAAAVLTRQP